MRTLRDLLTDAAQRHGDRPALRYKEAGHWSTLSYATLRARARTIEVMLRGLGIAPYDRVAILLENEVRWPELYFGIVGLGATAVPIDAKLREAEVTHILRDSGARAIFLPERAIPSLGDFERQAPALEHIVLLDTTGPLPPPVGNATWHDHAEATLSAKASEPATGGFADVGPAPDDVASIIYTSGTTGRQKGAMLTHANFRANVDAVRAGIFIRPGELFLLVLPLHHAFAFTANLLFPLAAGAEIAVAESPRTVGDNMREVSPSILIGVPLLFEKLYRKIQSGLRTSATARMLLALGIRGPVRRKVRASLGGRLRLCVVGGAPSDPAMVRGFARLGIPLLEGYGLTETAPVLTLNPPDAPHPGTVGKPIAGVEVRIDAPNADGVGEILARGANVMPGYFRNERATGEVIRDGWFRTGDLGRLDADGYLTITGRRKSLIVNREGKNISPEEVEANLLASPLIAECIVLGYRAPGETGERVGVILVPNQEAMEGRRTPGGMPPGDDETVAILRDEVRRIGRHLADYKRPRSIQVRTEEFEKTSTGKVKRYLYAIDPVEV